MIDNFAIGLTHFLLAVGLWRIMLRPDLDRDPDEPATRPRLARRSRRARGNAPLRPERGDG